MPSVVVGPEIHHAVLTRRLREALSLALADLVRDEVVDMDQALELGRGVLRDNAARLYRLGRPGSPGRPVDRPAKGR